MWRILLAFKCFFLVLFSRRLPPEAAELLPAPDRERERGASSDGAARLGAADTAAPRELPAPGAARPIERSQAAHQPTSPVSPAEAPAAPDAATSQKRGAVLLLGLLQREGRLLDFLQEEVDGYSDAQIGAAVRDIHRGCRKVLAEHVRIEPVMGEPDNATVRIDAGFDPSRIRLVGNVAGPPPFVGTLRHPGWRGVDIKLPELPRSHDASVIAPAEVEV